MGQMNVTFSSIQSPNIFIKSSRIRVEVKVNYHPYDNYLPIHSFKNISSLILFYQGFIINQVLHNNLEISHKVIWMSQVLNNFNI